MPQNSARHGWLIAMIAILSLPALELAAVRALLRARGELLGITLLHGWVVNYWPALVLSLGMGFHILQKDGPFVLRLARGRRHGRHR